MHQMMKIAASLVIIAAMALAYRSSFNEAPSKHKAFTPPAKMAQNTDGARFSPSRRNNTPRRRRPSRGEKVTGIAFVIDGDSLRIAGVEIRLFGIDAPEGRQYCNEDTPNPRPCGRQAARALRQLIAGKTLNCSHKDTDTYGRMVAVCLFGDTDINGWMVANGQAIALRRYSHDYVPHETRAKAQKLGLWSGSFTPPWIWRRQNR